MAVVSYLLFLTDPAHGGVTGIHAQALEEGAEEPARLTGL